jgi:hypothetical protein
MSNEIMDHEEISLAVQARPEIVLLDRQKFDDFYTHIRGEVDGHQPDTTTDAGRKAIASLAFKIARTKTAIDNAGKELNAGLRERINLVDASRREIREKLDALKEEARRPLTEWETAEKERQEYCQHALLDLREAGVIRPVDTSADVAARLDGVKRAEPDPGRFGEHYKAACDVWDDAVLLLEAALVRIRKEEEDARELERLRAEKVAREAAEAEAVRVAEEERRAAEEAERVRLEEEERAARIAREAEERAKRAAEEESRRAAAELERQHRAEVERLQREKEAAEARERETALELARQEARRKAEEDRAREEAERKAEFDRKLAASRKHRAAVMAAAAQALTLHAGLDEVAAISVVKAIREHKVPAVELRFS